MTAEPARRLVIDASVLAKWVVPEPESAEVRTLIRSAVAGEAELSAPAHIIAETLNVIWKHAFLLRTITVDEAKDSLRFILTVPIELRPLDELAAPALELALAHGRTVHDCLYVALALRDGSELVTADRALAETFGPTTSQVMLLSEFEAPL